MSKQELFEAFKYDELSKIISLLTVISPNIKDSDGESLLHLTLRSHCTKNLQTIKFLIDKGININIQNSYTITPLIKALLMNRPDAAILLIENGANVNCFDKDTGNTPLHLASQEGFTEVVEKLITLTKIDCFNHNRDTPLFLAAYRGHEDIVRIMIENEANINLKNDCRNTVLHAAIANGDILITKLLLEKKIDVNSLNNSFASPLNIAIEKGFSEIAEMLLMHDKIDINPINRNNMSLNPLIIAIKGGHTHIVELLLEKGANPNLPEHVMDTQPLYYAIEKGYTDIVRLLIKYSADVNFENTNDGTQYLHLATKYGYTDIVDSLILGGANLNIAGGYYSKSALHIACHKGYYDIIQLLIKAGADVNIIDDQGETPLLISVSHSDTEIVKLLLQSGADPNLFTINKFTPLEVAKSNGDNSTYQILINYNESLKTLEVDTPEKFYPQHSSNYKSLTKEENFYPQNSSNYESLTIVPNSFGPDYTNNSHVQDKENEKITKEFAEKISENFKEGKYGNEPLIIADIACGHAKPTYQLLNHLKELSVPIAQIIGYDISEPLISKANEDYKNIPELSFYLQNMATIGDIGRFHIIVSFFGLQCADNINNTAKVISTAIKPGGSIMFLAPSNKIEFFDSRSKFFWTKAQDYGFDKDFSIKPFFYQLEDYIKAFSDYINPATLIAKEYIEELHLTKDGVIKFFSSWIPEYRALNMANNEVKSNYVEELVNYILNKNIKDLRYSFENQSNDFIIDYDLIYYYADILGYNECSPSNL